MSKYNASIESISGLRYESLKTLTKTSEADLIHDLDIKLTERDGVLPYES